MPGRYESSDDYRYGFNGKENDNEIKGIGNSIDFGARMYDSRLGRWFAIDPLDDKRTWISPYNFVQNNPIFRIDPDGKLDNPIYGSDGLLRGYDSEGLDGQAIIYDGEFYESMD